MAANKSTAKTNTPQMDNTHKMYIRLEEDEAIN